MTSNGESMVEREIKRTDNGSLYQKIAERSQYQANILLSGIDRKVAGEKLFLSGRDILWSSAKAPGLLRLSERFAGEESSSAAICGTTLLALPEGRVFCERIGNEPAMVICGGGHVSIPIIRLAKSIGFHLTVLEDRPVFAGQAREAGADEVICRPFSDGMEQVAGTPDTCFVIVTRGHRYDTLCLRKAVLKPNAYIGMMGSRKRVGMVKEQLIAEGISREVLEHVHMPIGLPIGAETPEEIAVSVMAEIIKVKNAGKKGEGYTKELLSYLTGQKGGGKRKILATVIAKKGSGPRKAGTKMLVFEDGALIGTIGGGSAEAKIKEACLLMLKERYPAQQAVVVDMTGKEAEDAGMVCGGTMEVLLEEIAV